MRKLLFIFILTSKVASGQITWSTSGIVDQFPSASPGSNQTLTNQGPNASTVGINFIENNTSNSAPSNYLDLIGAGTLSWGMNSNGPGPGNYHLLTFSFSKPFCGLSFNIGNGAINFRDVISISANAVKGTNSPTIAVSPIDVNMATVSGPTITAGTNSSSANISFPGSCITSISMQFSTGSDTKNQPNAQLISLGNFTVATSPFPLKLTSFTADQDAEQIGLFWSSTDEENFSGFNVERSFDAKSFETLGLVSSEKEISNGKKNYIFQDTKPKVGQNYYRLKMINLDQSFEYSGIISQNFVSDKFTLKPYPNPVALNGVLKIDNKIDLSQLRFYDVMGREVFPILNTNEVYFKASGKYYIQAIHKNGQKLSKTVLVE
jgi:hypothetical protein